MFLLQSGRLRNAVKTFIEAMNGSYKDGSAGTRDYRALPGLLLLLRPCKTVRACLCTFYTYVSTVAPDRRLNNFLFQCMYTSHSN